MAIPKKKKSLLQTAKEKAEKDEKNVTVAMRAKSIQQLQDLYEDGMFMMNEGFIGPEANAGDVGLFYNGLGKARKYGRLLRKKGIKVPIPRGK